MVCYLVSTKLPSLVHRCALSIHDSSAEEPEGIRLHEVWHEVGSASISMVAFTCACAASTSLHRPSRPRPCAAAASAC